MGMENRGPILQLFRSLACMTGLMTVERGSRQKEEEFPGLGDWAACGTIHGNLEQLGRIRFVGQEQRVEDGENEFR